MSQTEKRPKLEQPISPQTPHEWFLSLAITDTYNIHNLTLQEKKTLATKFNQSARLQAGISGFSSLYKNAMDKEYPNQLLLNNMVNYQCYQIWQVDTYYQSNIATILDQWHKNDEFAVIDSNKCGKDTPLKRSLNLPSDLSYANGTAVNQYPIIADRLKSMSEFFVKLKLLYEQQCNLYQNSILRYPTIYEKCPFNDYFNILRQNYIKSVLELALLRENTICNLYKSDSKVKRLFSAFDKSQVMLNTYCYYFEYDRKNIPPSFYDTIINTNSSNNSNNKNDKDDDVGKDVESKDNGNNCNDDGNVLEYINVSEIREKEFDQIIQDYEDQLLKIDFKFKVSQMAKGLDKEWVALWRLLTCDKEYVYANELVKLLTNVNIKVNVRHEKSSCDENDYENFECPGVVDFNKKEILVYLKQENIKNKQIFKSGIKELLGNNNNNNNNDESACRLDSLALKEGLTYDWIITQFGPEEDISAVNEEVTSSVSLDIGKMVTEIDG